MGSVVDRESRTVHGDGPSRRPSISSPSSSCPPDGGRPGVLGKVEDGIGGRPKTMTVAVRVGNDGQSASAAPGIDAADVSIVGVTVVGIIRVVVVVVGTAPPATGGGGILTNGVEAVDVGHGRMRNAAESVR